MPDPAADLAIERAECLLPGGVLAENLRFFIDTLGFRLDSIMPADDPRLAQLSGHGLCLLLDTAYLGDPGILRLRCTPQDLPATLVAPNGTRIEFAPLHPAMHMPPLRPSLSIQRGEAHAGVWKTGRAGMQYRDLIPDRQGGQFIASHIRIAQGGPVGDNVHYHDIRLQLIYCYRGWVRLVYEDQGEPFVMHAGDCVLQPPHIRHRVLESSDGLEVIELGSPAEHMTYLDHEMNLPTGRELPAREFNGQRFMFHQAASATWPTDPASDWAVRDLGIGAATAGLAGARVLRRASSRGADVASVRQDNAFAFAFVLEGSMTLQLDQQPATTLKTGDAFVIPTGMQQTFADCSPDWQLLQICQPA